MRKLKFSILVVAMLVVATVAHAQVDLGIKAGVNMSNVYGDNVKNDNVKIGFNVGIAADYGFSYSTSLQTGLFLSTKGYERKVSDTEYSVNMMYLQLPLHLAYKIDVTPGTRVVLHAGPYAAYGISGKRSLKSGNYEIDLPVKVFDGQFKPFDFGAGLGVGAEFGQFLVDLGWDMGLIDISKTSNKKKTQNAYLSVGYKF